MMLTRFYVVATVLILGGAAVAGEEAATVRQSGGRILLEYDQAIRAVIDPQHGGEVSGLSVMIDGEWQELIYRAVDYSDQPGWRGKAPLLWPATGVTISKTGGRFSYTTDDRLYEMPMHGFARTHAWDVLASKASEDSATTRLGLTDSDRTRSLYPFGFNLQVEYSVDRCGLQIHYQVAANSDNRWAMPFSIGNHITFRLPLVEASLARETRFQTNLPQEYILDSRRVFTGRTRPSRYTGQHRVGELPHRRAISLGSDADRPYVRVLDPSGFFVTLSHRVPDGVPARTVLFNLWADLEESFFSPEPWIGAQNSLNSGYGLVSLPPGRTWDWRIRIQPSTLDNCETKT
jgi:galactose mutarotase-like enzyme